MHPIDWNWSERVDCGGPLSLAVPTSVPNPYFPCAAASPFPRFQPLSVAATTLSRSGATLKPAMAIAGRKRSRDESSYADDYDSSDLSRGSSSPPKAPGFSRTSSNQQSLADSSHDPSSSSVAGGAHNSSWADELSARLRSSSVVERGRPPLEARKSMRLGLEVPGASDAVPALIDADEVMQPDHGALGVPLHDAASMALGVGWHMLSPAHASDSLAAAIRGWTTFVESRFPLSSVKFEWGKKSEPKAYLVGAVSKIGRSPGYYLFQEDLLQARLVAKSWERALDNLRQGTWESEELLVARDPSAWGAEVRGMEMGQAEPYVQNGMNTAAEHQFLNGIRHMGHPTSAQAHQVIGGGMDLD